MADRRSIRHGIRQNEIEAAEHSSVEYAGQIGRCNDDRRPGVLIEELKERIQDTAGFSNVVLTTTRSGKSVDLVKEIDAACGLDGIEDHFELLRGLAHELRDQPMQHDGEERVLQLARKSRGAQRLACPRRA